MRARELENGGVSAIPFGGYSRLPTQTPLKRLYDSGMWVHIRRSSLDRDSLGRCIAFACGICHG